MIKLITLFASLLSISAVIAGNKDSLNKTSIAATQFITPENIPAKESSVKTRQFGDLDKYLEQQLFNIENEGADLTDSYIEEYNADVDPTVLGLRSKAAKTIEELIAKNRFINFLNPSKIQQLPLGWQFNTGSGTKVTIAISKAAIYADSTVLSAFAKLDIPSLSEPLFFGVEGMRLSKDGGIIGGNTKLVLLGNVAIPINNNTAALILKGDQNLRTGLGDNSKTYIAFDCNGFKELSVGADVELSRNVAVPVDNNGVEKSGRVTAHLKQFAIKGWNDMIVDDVDFEDAFQLKNFPGFIFTIHDVVFDFSDTKKSDVVRYPTGYQQKYLQAELLETWRGFYAHEISIKLPASFKDKTKPGGVTISVFDMIIDNNGLSGTFCAQNIISLENGNASKWRFSLDTLCVGLEASRLMRAGFGGSVMLPVCKYDAAKPASNNRRKLGYSAMISGSGDYVLRVVAKNKIDFDVFLSKVTLYENSYIKLYGNKDNIDAEAKLSGTIQFKLPSLVDLIIPEDDDDDEVEDEEAPAAKFNGIKFKNLFIATREPYLDIEYLGYDGEIKIGNFPVSIESLSIEKKIVPDGKEYALSLGLKMNLGDGTIIGETGLKIIGKSDETGGIFSIKYNRCKIDSIKVDADVKGAFKLKGSLIFFEKNATATAPAVKGFNGAIEARFKGLDADIKLRAEFAKTPTYRYWFVDGLVEFGTGIGGIVKLQGFGGGAYYHMRKLDEIDTDNDTEIKYEADENVGLGVMARVLFSVGDKKLVKGTASFEIAFNSSGGIRYIGLFGKVKVMGDILEGLEIGEELKKKIKKIKDFEKTLTEIAKEQLKKLKLTALTAAAEQQEQSTDDAGKKPGENETGFSAYIGIQYDFQKQSLHASLDMRVSAAKGLIRGSGENNRAGWAVFHVEPGKWWLHIGTPTNPCGIKFGIGKFNITTTAYFMVGYEMPAFPPPPQKVIEILNKTGLHYDDHMSQGDLEGGRGLAFGAAINVNSGDLNFLFFYANFAAGIGFDVMLKDYGNVQCAGMSEGERVGVNGWYAKGQAYAYLWGELGVKIKIFFIKKKFSIIKGGAAALFQAKLPNPTWVGGYLGFHVSILGGLISGNFSFKFNFGKDCEFVSDDPSPVDEELQIIEEVTPENNASPFVKPTIRLRIPNGSVLQIPREDGRAGYNNYYPFLEDVKLYKVDGNQLQEAATAFNGERNILTITPKLVLQGNTQYKILTTIRFKKFVHPDFVPWVENGTPLQEVRQFTFTTGDAPVAMDSSIISKMYPYFNQRNFYPGETNKGSIELSQNFPEYFDNFGNWKIKVYDTDGNEISNVNATTDGQKRFDFALPSNLETSKTYNLMLFGEQPAPGVTNVDLTKPSLQFSFTTSRYRTLADKIRTLNVTENIVGRVSSDVINLQTAVADYEGFELHEVGGCKYTGEDPMVQGELDIAGEHYYNVAIKPIVYPNEPGNYTLPNGHAFSIEEQGAADYGVPPFKAVIPSWFYINALKELHGQEPAAGSPQFQEFTGLLKTRLPFVYNGVKYYNLHFIELRKAVINYCIQSGINMSTLPDNTKALLEQPFPFMDKGQYKVKFSFVQLDGTKGAPVEFIYTNPID
ncbi:MAG: hypothetical protein QM791_16895 [Ferruginibacter sp.]